MPEPLLEGRDGKEGTSTAKDVVDNSSSTTPSEAPANLTSEQTAEGVDRGSDVEHVLRLVISQQGVGDHVLDQVLEAMPPVADLAVDDGVVASDQAVGGRTYLTQQERSDADPLVLLTKSTEVTMWAWWARR